MDIQPPQAARGPTATTQHFDDPPRLMTRSPSRSSSLDSAELEHLQVISDAVVQKVGWYEDEVVRMHNDLARRFGLGAPVAHFEELTEEHIVVAAPTAANASSSRIITGHHHAAETGGEEEDAASAAWTTGTETHAELEKQREHLRRFEPCQHLRLRLDLHPSDRDFISHAVDKQLSTDFRDGVNEYIRGALLDYVGKIPLEELKEIGVSHANRCFRNISAAEKRRRRILLEQSVTENERGPDGFIGGLETVLDSHSGVRPKLPPQTTRKSFGKVPANLRTASSRENGSSILASISASFADESVEVSGRSDVPDGMPPTLRTNRRATKKAHKESQRPRHQTPVEAVPGPPFSAAKSAHYRGSRAALLRWRELGGGQLDSRRAHSEHIHRQLRSQALSQLQPWRQWSKAAKDVLTTVWSPSGRYFGIGATSDLDSQNIQYNDRGTLLYGDIECNNLLELDDHRITRFRAETGVNALQDTINTLDPFLYTTVTDIRFDENNDLMFTSSYDRTVKIWDLSEAKPKCQQTLVHSESVAVMDLNADSTCLATIQDSKEDPLTLFRLERGVAHEVTRFGTDSTAKTRFTPTCLQFGKTRNSAHLLLAGFSENSNEYAVKNREGQLSLWDIRSSSFARIKLVSTSRAVHDAIWSPHTPIFTAAVAIDPSNPSANRAGIQSHIRTWSPLEAMHKIYEFDCPALDINELRFHPYNPNYVSASCTDGATYVWDARRTGYDQYITCLKHGEPIDAVDDMVVGALGYARAREELDTGVKFVAWDSGGHCLYTGSSDGVVKQWNPWVAAEDALVRDVMTAQSGVTAGAFSPDHSHLLVGLANGAIRILSSAPLTTSGDARSADIDTVECRAETINFVPAKTIPEEAPYEQAAHELVATGQVAIHPDLGAMQGPRYRGPYAAWARTGARGSASDLASTELDPDVLADQIHPRQWHRGLEAGGQPTVAAQERQRWLQQRNAERARAPPCKPKRALERPSSSESQPMTPPARKRRPPPEPLSLDSEPLVSSDTGFLTPLVSSPSEDEHTPERPPLLLMASSHSFIETPLTPTRPGVTSQTSWAARSATPTGDTTRRSFPIRTPSPMTPRVHSSHSSFRSHGSDDYTPRPKPKFRMPPPAPESPFRDRAAARVQSQRSAVEAREKGKLIVLDDDE